MKQRISENNINQRKNRVNQTLDVQNIVKKALKKGEAGVSQFALQ